MLNVSEIDECVSDPCQNSATCNEIVNGYTCTCADGYTGTLCEAGLYSFCALLAFVQMTQRIVAHFGHMVITSRLANEYQIYVRIASHAATM